jgi:hypothetical protein
MPNGRFNGTAAPDHGFEPLCHTTLLSRSPDLHMLDIHPVVAAIDQDHFQLDL